MNAIIEMNDLNTAREKLKQSPWLVACLCAAWCDTCTIYRKHFEMLAQQQPDKCFAWIDIEDHAHLVDDIDIENFPTILIQYQDHVVFLGTMLPEISQLQRLISAITDNPDPGTIGRNSLNQDAPEGWSIRRQINSATQ